MQAQTCPNDAFCHDGGHRDACHGDDHRGDRDHGRGRHGERHGGVRVSEYSRAYDGGRDTFRARARARADFCRSRSVQSE